MARSLKYMSGYNQRMPFPLPIACFLFLFIICLSTGCIDTGGITPSSPSAGTNSSQDIRITDATGSGFTFHRPVSRIVVLNAAAAEMLIDIGVGDEIVGVADFIVADNHEFLRARLPNVARVGSFTNPDVEKILTLHPDIVIVYARSKPQNLDKMLAANITVLQMTCYRPAEVPNEARALGLITGHEEKADRFARFVERYHALINDRLRNLSEDERPRVYYEYVYENMAFGPGSSGGEIISLLHAKNIAENLPSQISLVSREWILEQDPDVIIKEIPDNSGNFSSGRKTLADRPGFMALHAVMKNRVFCVAPQLGSTPRSIVGAVFVAKALYPEKFSDIDPDAILHEYARDFLPGSDMAETFYPVPGSNEPSTNSQR
jgi:iron complex transport system substrate-binding protein